MTVKSSQAIAGAFCTVDGTGALTAATGTPVGTLYVAGVANGAAVTVTGANPYKWAVTLPTVTAGQVCQMYVTATVSAIATGGIVWTDIADTSILSDLPTAAENADAVWDEVLTAGAHDVGYSAGQRLRYLILTGNAAQAGTADTITLAAAESAIDNIFADNLISIVAGTGAGQTRLIVSYVGATRVATVDRAWTTNPAADSVYEILPFSGVVLSDYGIATGGAAATITLAATSSAIDDTYVGSVLFIASGTGAHQARVITSYNGTTKVATMGDAWTTQPVAGSVYKILPVGRVIVDSFKADSINASALATDAAVEIADALLTRDWTAVVGEAARSVLNALRFLRNKWSISGTTLTVTEEDDVTAAWVAAVTTDTTAKPVTSADPT